MISVVLRAKNEAEWIGRCLTALRGQRLADLDIILIDNESTDGTVAIAERFGVRVSHISQSDFTFGRALNQGISMAQNRVVALLSAHCIPANELWADYLLAHLDDDAPAANCGVYGRQEPLPDSSEVDRRDLWTTFRKERVVQSRDYFFHNANSAIRKEIWEGTPFDETLNGVEDSDWGRKLVGDGYNIVYEPAAWVYHHHGIHHGRDAVRAARVSKAVAMIRAAHDRDLRAAATETGFDADIIREEMMALGLPLGIWDPAAAPGPVQASPEKAGSSMIDLVAGELPTQSLAAAPVRGDGDWSLDGQPGKPAPPRADSRHDRRQKNNLTARTG